MKILMTAIAAAALVISLPATLSAEGKRITTAAEFSEKVVGKKLFIGDDWVIIQKNGKLRGNFDGKVTRGAWEWRETYWCRTLTKPRQNTDCQTWNVSGNKYIVKRELGKGRGFTYTTK